MTFFYSKTHEKH